MRPSGDIWGQLLRYGVVGLASNGILYVGYLLLTRSLLGPKEAMSLLYVVGVVQTFFFNRRWSFRHRGEGHVAFLRYWVAYGSGYVLNWGELYLLVDRLHLPHEPVQAFAILSVAAYLFLLQRYWVFAAPATSVEST